jgi:hypothetical protein
MDKVDFILKSMLQVVSKLEFDGDPESLSQPEKFPLKTEPYFMDDNQNYLWDRISTLDDLFFDV